MQLLCAEGVSKRGGRGVKNRPYSGALTRGGCGFFLVVTHLAHADGTPTPLFKEFNLQKPLSIVRCSSSGITEE